ncbi:ribosomal-protein-alanine N-acetyltransferase [bacterium]|nr:ribosomal-protein-alanine N-acetyltransferase [bacterium]
MSFGQSPRSSSTGSLCGVQIRWMIRRDMPEVLEIERQSFDFAWTEEDFLCCLRQRNCIGMVAEHQERIVGFMIYELLKSQLHVLNFAVDPGTRRMGVGVQMIEKLVTKLAQQRRKELRLEVREGNLAAQLFFKQQGFTATNVLRNYYEDTTEDAYVMRYLLNSPGELLAGPHFIRNRITEYEDGVVES